MQSTRTFLQRYVLLLIAIVIILILASVYELGYRVGPQVTLERVGTLTLTGMPEGTNVFVDEKMSGAAGKDGKRSVELVGGAHQVIVDASGDYPWSTNVTVESGKTVSISPIFVKTKLEGTALTGSEKAAALATIASTTLPSSSMPLLFNGGCTEVYMSNNQIIESPATSTPSCTPPPYLCTGGVCEPTIIYAPLAHIQAVLPFPKRQDAVVILLDHNMYALALDPRSPQFFAPIAHGTNPKAGVLQDGTVVVSDGGAVSSLSF